jgi:hypothetical protein
MVRKGSMRPGSSLTLIIMNNFVNFVYNNQHYEYQIYHFAAQSPKSA